MSRKRLMPNAIESRKLSYAPCQVAAAGLPPLTAVIIVFFAVCSVETNSITRVR